MFPFTLINPTDNCTILVSNNNNINNLYTQDDLFYFQLKHDISNYHRNLYDYPFYNNDNISSTSSSLNSQSSSVDSDDDICISPISQSSPLDISDNSSPVSSFSSLNINNKDEEEEYDDTCISPISQSSSLDISDEDITTLASSPPSSLIDSNSENDDDNSRNVFIKKSDMHCTTLLFDDKEYSMNYTYIDNTVYIQSINIIAIFGILANNNSREFKTVITKHKKNVYLPYRATKTIYISVKGFIKWFKLKRFYKSSMTSINIQKKYYSVIDLFQNFENN